MYLYKEVYSHAISLSVYGKIEVQVYIKKYINVWKRATFSGRVYVYVYVWYKKFFVNNVSDSEKKLVLQSNYSITLYIELLYKWFQ